MWIDGHLDLAYNASLGRDLTLGLGALRACDPVEGQTATVSFEELRRAGVGLCLGTLFAAPQTNDHAGYTDWRGARAQAISQLEQYQRWQDGGFIRLLGSGAEISAHAAKYDQHPGDPAASPLGVVLLMEGADPLRDVDDLPFWHKEGVRAIGLSWGKTRFAGGTAAAGPLTERGRELLAGMRELGVAQDLSHLDEQAFFEAVELQPRCFASHSNSRAVLKLGSAEGNRHLSDEMARAIGERGGIIGLVLVDSFLKGGWTLGDPRVELQQVLRHAERYAELIGWDKVGLGSDLDGGFGNEKTPLGIDQASDLGRLAEVFPDEARDGVMGGNWLRWLGANL
ncbi:peptidase M19 [Deinococcus psychrotolerans]|uniref:Peptidase M19 n=1 Tax=Deinococcus psychrotolerans TaxID=2489213 RepID=A0A3G8YEC8_9DEIO|nr:membrane dipeptidase [Deinococcus psychrotolerans]AZI43739.1 peptidase M19 [Deinococcus psychrotolerans]